MSSSEGLTYVELNQTLTDADTEYEVTIPSATKFIEFQCRTAFDVRYAFTTGKVATPTGVYFTCKSGDKVRLPEKLSWSGTIYFASSQAAVVVEILGWKAT